MTTTNTTHITKTLTALATFLFLCTGIGTPTATATTPDLSWIDQYPPDPSWDWDIRKQIGYQQLPFPGNYDGLPTQQEMIAIIDHLFRAAPAARGHTIINEYTMPHARADGPTGMYINRFGTDLSWDEGLSAKLPPEIHRLLGTKPINIVAYKANFVLTGTEQPRSVAWLKRVFDQMVRALNSITECSEVLDLSATRIWPQYSTGCEVHPRITSNGYIIDLALGTSTYCKKCSHQQPQPPGIYLEVDSWRIAENFQGGTTPTIIPKHIYLKP